MGKHTVKEIERGMYIAEVSKDEIAQISKPLIESKKLTPSTLKELSPGVYMTVD